MGQGNKRRGLQPNNNPQPNKTTGDYEYFTDTAIDDYSYTGTGKNVKKFFKDNSNVGYLITHMNRRERYAFEMWSIGQFMSGQQYRGFSNMTPLEQLYTRTYDKIIDRATLDKGIVVHRLAGFELINNGSNGPMDLAQLHALEGSTVISLGNMSTAAAAEGLTIGSRDKKVDYEIHIPGGSTGAGMWIGDYRINSAWGPEQREFMTNRDIELKVGKATYNQSTDTYTVPLYYIKREPHRYN